MSIPKHVLKKKHLIMLFIRVTLHQTINKTPVETTNLTAHPSSAGISYISVIMSPTSILVRWQLSFLTMKVPVSRILLPQEPRREISHCLWNAHMMDASVYLRSQVIYLHRGTNDQRKRTSNHSSTPFHTVYLRSCRQHLKWNWNYHSQTKVFSQFYGKIYTKLTKRRLIHNK